MTLQPIPSAFFISFLSVHICHFSSRSWISHSPIVEVHIWGLWDPPFSSPAKQSAPTSTVSLSKPNKEKKLCNFSSIGKIFIFVFSYIKEINKEESKYVDVFLKYLNTRQMAHVQIHNDDIYVTPFLKLLCSPSEIKICRKWLNIYWDEHCRGGGGVH